MDFVYMLRTPVIMVTKRDKSTLEFFTEADYRDWENTTGSKTTGWSMKYYKGLSSWSTNQFAKFLSDLPEYMCKITMDEPEDRDALDLVFNESRADERKTWLETPAEDFDKFVIVN